ncbi:unnamed protein product [Allacma fusca]|uniref:SCP domain-containing protein n=1 Tax=Allacma fusca TaxID=39272 RepID=A0A8J2Q501_9HEXA|nr:unnamed protein product [Allacma fusca]
MHARGGSLTTPTCNCGSNGAETCGISANESPSQRARGAISDPTQLSWFSQYVNPTGPALSWPNPVYDASYAEYTQMIWVDTQMVGCGTSTTQAATLTPPTNPPIQAPQYVFCCCWVRAGNTPSTFSQNVLEDTV